MFCGQENACPLIERFTSIFYTHRNRTLPTDRRTEVEGRKMVPGEAVKGIARKFRGELKKRKAGHSALLAVVIAGAGILSGCAGLANTSNSNLTPDEIQITLALFSFPNVSVGSTATQLAT